jgi:hypothetical protein
MRVFEVAAGSGGIDGLKRGERAEPTPGPGKVVIEI